jgi:glycogen(starch) synthase
MRVLAFTPQYLPVRGGIEVFSDALARSLKLRSVETTVVTDMDLHGLLPEREVLGDILVHRLGFLSALRANSAVRPLQVLQRLTEITDDIRPDLIHIHSAVQASAWFVDRMLGKRAPKLPFLVTQHGMLEEVDRQNVARSLMRKADMLTAVSQASLQSAIEFSGVSSNTAVIYNGVLPVAAGPRPHRPGPPFGLVCVGRLQHEKGFDLAIRALAAVRESGIDADLTIVGQGEDKRQFVALVEALGLRQHVRFAGVLDRQDTLDIMARNAILLAPSRTREGFGLVVVEAALSGVPCIASRLGGLQETVEDGVTGILVAPGDDGELAQAIVALLRDPIRLRELGANAQSRGKRRFGMDRCAMQYLEAYCRVIDRRRVVA